MKCYKCGSFLYDGDYCNACGTDIRVYRDIVTKSNELYNSALEYAKDRNLSKAVEHLRTSLKMYKGNINAHNLLGLIYFEMGEYTEGFAHWVISKNIQPDNNLAGAFLNQIQEDKAYLDSINAAIKKYNKAIGYLEQGNYDLGEIQLKKLINSDNIHMLKAYQLLALLRIRKKKYAAASKILQKAESIDAGNPITIAYKTYVLSQLRSEEKDLTAGEIKNKRLSEDVEEDSHSPLSGDDVIIPKSSYREYNPTTVAIIQILVGFIVGAAIIFFVVVPAKTKSIRAEASKTQSEMEAQIEDLQKELEQSQNASASVDNTDTASENQSGSAEEAENQTTAAASTEDEQALASAYEAYQNGDYDTGAEFVLNIKNPDAFDEAHKAQYEIVKTMLDGMPDKWYNLGMEAFDDGDYQTALDYFTKVYNLENTTGESLYYMGLCNYNMDVTAEAINRFTEYINTYPDGAHVDDCSYLLSLIS